MLGPGRLRAIRDGLAVAGLLFAAYLFLIEAPQTKTVGYDAWAYWHIGLVAHPYDLPEGALGGFLYPPAMAQLLAPASQLSWPAFWWLWTALLVATVVWLGWRSALLLLAFPPVAVELYHGNVHLLVAAAIALGFRYPAAWAIVLLSKVTPGIGLLWFAVRREWRSLAIALGVTGGLVAVSIAIDANLWREWIVDGIVPALTGPPAGGPSVSIPLVIRAIPAIAIVVWGARTDRRWTVPVAAALAMPVLWYDGFAVLVAIAAVNRPELRERAA
jgi:glycosyl transferase family 87